MFGVVPKPLWEKRIAAGRAQSDSAWHELRAGSHGREEDSGRNRRGRQTGCEAARTFTRLGRAAAAGTARGARSDARRRGYRGEHAPAFRSLRLEHAHRGRKAVPRFPMRDTSCSAANSNTPKRPTSATGPATCPKIFCRSKRPGSGCCSRAMREIAPGVELIRVPGHNADMQCVRLSGGGKTAFCFVDLVPTTAHLPFPWIMGYDLYPMQTLENKKKWIPEIARSERAGDLCARCERAGGLFAATRRINSKSSRRGWIEMAKKAAQQKSEKQNPAMRCASESSAAAGFTPWRDLTAARSAREDAVRRAIGCVRDRTARRAARGVSGAARTRASAFAERDQLSREYLRDEDAGRRAGDFGQRGGLAARGYAPLDFLIPDQFFDRTRAAHLHFFRRRSGGARGLRPADLRAASRRARATLASARA